MKKIRFSNQFKKEFRLAGKRKKDLNKFYDLMNLLEHESDLPQKYKDHKLQGNFEGCRECHLEPDWLLIYRVLSDGVLFERTGTHSDLFKK